MQKFLNLPGSEQKMKTLKRRQQERDVAAEKRTQKPIIQFNSMEPKRNKTSWQCY
jgi:hypothetical protein